MHTQNCIQAHMKGSDCYVKFALKNMLTHMKASDIYIIYHVIMESQEIQSKLGNRFRIIKSQVNGFTNRSNIFSTKL